jgi:hypothetical protein
VWYKRKNIPEWVVVKLDLASPLPEYLHTDDFAQFQQANKGLTLAGLSILYAKCGLSCEECGTMPDRPCIPTCPCV